MKQNQKVGNHLRNWKNPNEPRVRLILTYSWFYHPNVDELRRTTAFWEPNFSIIWNVWVGQHHFVHTCGVTNCTGDVDEILWKRAGKSEQPDRLNSACRARLFVMYVIHPKVASCWWRIILVIFRLSTVNGRYFDDLTFTSESPIKESPIVVYNEFRQTMMKMFAYLL